MEDPYGIKVPESRFSNSRVFSGRYHLLQHSKQFLPSTPTACEIGVAEGYFSQIILDSLVPSKLILLDTYTHSSIYGIYTPQTHLSFVENKFSNVPHVLVKKGLSWDSLNLLEPDSLDFIYVDGDHSYDSLKKDIAASYRVLKSGGVIQFNDYTTFSPVEQRKYGVLHAVNEFLEAHDADVLGYSLDKNGYSDIAVRVRK